ncbi:MAG: sigma factor G inhibitor Gin [Bacillus sp. (in: firmicutes)]
MNDKAKIPSEISCVVCETNKGEGIQLFTSFLCIECERKIIQTSTNDPEYKFYLNQLKKIRTELLS